MKTGATCKDCAYSHRFGDQYTCWVGSSPIWISATDEVCFEFYDKDERDTDVLAYLRLKYPELMCDKEYIPVMDPLFFLTLSDYEERRRARENKSSFPGEGRTPEPTLGYDPECMTEDEFGKILRVVSTMSCIWNNFRKELPIVMDRYASDLANQSDKCESLIGETMIRLLQGQDRKDIEEWLTDELIRRSTVNDKQAVYFTVRCLQMFMDGKTIREFAEFVMDEVSYRKRFEIIGTICKQTDSSEVAKGA